MTKLISHNLKGSITGPDMEVRDKGTELVPDVLWQVNNFRPSLFITCCRYKIFPIYIACTRCFYILRARYLLLFQTVQLISLS